MAELTGSLETLHREIEDRRRKIRSIESSNFIDHHTARRECVPLLADIAELEKQLEECVGEKKQQVLAADGGHKISLLIGQREAEFNRLQYAPMRPYDSRIDDRINVLAGELIPLRAQLAALTSKE